MKRTRRNYKPRRSAVKIEDEIQTLEELAESHRREIKNHQRKLAQEKKSLEDAAKTLEDLRQKQAQEEEEERRRQEEINQEKKRKKREELDDADLPWEKLSEDGVCGRCRDLGIDCYRVIEGADTRRSRRSAKSLRVQIGDRTYSRCQECRVHKRKCENYTGSTQTSALPIVPVKTNPSKGKRKREVTPETPNTRAKLEEGAAQLPTPSNERSPSRFRVIPGSNSHFPIPLQATPGPSNQSSSVSRKVQLLEKAIEDIRNEQRTTRELLEDAIARLRVGNGQSREKGRVLKRTGGDRELSYVSDSE